MKAPSQRAMNARSGGFTLIELLIAITLMGLVAALMSGSIRFGARVWETGAARADANTELLVTQRVIRRILTEVAPVSLEADAGGGALVFAGTPTSIRFVGTRASDFLVGGPYAYRVFARRTERGNEVVMAYSLFVADTDRDSAADESEEVLLENVGDVTFAYFGSMEEGTAPAWHDRWESQDGAPDLVRMDVAFEPKDTDRWPTLVVAPRTAVPFL